MDGIVASRWRVLVALTLGLLLGLGTVHLGAQAQAGTDDHFVYLPLIFQPPKQIDLAVTVTSAPDPYVAGAPLTYTVAVENRGPDRATGLQVDLQLPEGVHAPTYTVSMGDFTPESGAWLSLTLDAGEAAVLTVGGSVSATAAATHTLHHPVVVSPTDGVDPTPVDAGMINVNPAPLQNPGFEGGHWHKTFEGENEIMAVPESWIAWWVTGQSPLGETLVAPDVFRVIDSKPEFLSPVLRIRSGEQALQIARRGAYRAGIYQRLEGLPPGASVSFTAYTHAWACNEFLDPPLSCGDPYAFRSRVGIDPTGEDARNLEDVVWSEDHWIYDEFAPVGAVTAQVSDDGVVTVYLESYGKWPYSYNEAYWDDAALIIRP